MKTTKKIIIAGAFTAGFTSGANALEIDVYGAFGMGDEPFVQYKYTDGTTNNLMAGEGQGIYVGHTQNIMGPLNIQVRGGIQHGFISAEDNFYRDTFTYFPVYANVMFNVTPELSLVGGAVYALNPFYKITVGEANGTQKLQSDVGFNVALRWSDSPISVENDGALYLEVRYEYLEAEFTTYSDSLGDSADYTGMFEPVPVSNLGLAIGYRF